jgi:hypothetical protein
MRYELSDAEWATIRPIMSLGIATFGETCWLDWIDLHARQKTRRGFQLRESGLSTRLAHA